MTSRWIWIVALTVALGMAGSLLVGGALLAQDDKGGGREMSEREREFAEQMKDSVLIGTFRLMTENGLSSSHDEVYTVEGAEKIYGENWTVKSRIQYGTTDVTVPIPIKLYWIEDTPVISVTDLLIPGVGTYTSRVQVYRGCYAGTWFGKGYGGTLSGRIMKRADYEKMKAKKEAK